MPLDISISLNDCNDCRHASHSGAFTPGGAQPICGHPKATECVKIIKDLPDDGNPNDPYTKHEDQYYHWKHRVLPHKRVPCDWHVDGTYQIEGKIPNWCPLMNGGKY
jgi:hypothetical protein